MLKKENSILNQKINTFSEMLKSYRISKGMTQIELAKRIGLSLSKRDRDSTSERYRNSTIRNYETGKRHPSIKNIYSLSKVLGIEKDALFNLVLKEKIRTYNLKASILYINAKNGKDSKFNFGFFSFERKTGLHSKKISKLFKEARLKRGLSRSEISSLIKNKKGRKYRHSFTLEVEKNLWFPSVRYLIDYFESLDEDPFPIFEELVREKTFAHVKEAISQWEKYKKNMMKYEKNYLL